MPKITLDLTGKWDFKEYPISARRMRDLDKGNWFPADVPASIFRSLIQAGRINESDLLANPENFEWVSQKPWVYRKTFDSPDELLGCDGIELLFEGLDTISSIWLNDKLVGRTENMFIPHRFDVAGQLKKKNNRLFVKFEPALVWAEALQRRYGLIGEHVLGNSQRVYIRKAQYHFGWDWCPALPGCGIWRPVRLEGTEKSRIDEVYIRTVECNQHYADIRVAVKLQNRQSGPYLCRLTVYGGSLNIKHDLHFAERENSHSAVIRIERPFLWWPLGYGIQYLYNLRAELIHNGHTIDTADEKFGVRTLHIDRSNDEYGEKFQFFVNGRPIYVQGANWVPASVFAGDTKAADYERLLQMARNARMNMLRVWGGGIYENNEFYEICDSLGILVWQDFMFACAYYPDRSWFIKQVEAEAQAVIKRLRNHPCLALWCGNNEIQWLHEAGYLGKGKKFYGKTIYHKLLPRMVSELDTNRDYIPTTPLKPKEPNSGTTHQWNIWNGDEPINNYLMPPEKIPRFVTEFGLASPPHIETVHRFGPVEKLSTTSFIVEKHNYQLNGNTRLHRYMTELFGPAKNLEQFIYLSQLTQARGIKTFVEHLRAHHQRNYGQIFWQLNDCFPAISWSAIDFDGKPKALHYYASRFFAPILLVIVPTYKKHYQNLPPVLRAATIIAVNQTNRPLTATLSCKLADFYGNEIDKTILPVAISPYAASSPFALPKAMVQPTEPDNCYLQLALESDGKEIAKNNFLYWPDKFINWPKVQITHRLIRMKQDKWQLKLKTNVLAKDVQITTQPYAQLSDNFIDLLPGREVEIILNSIPSSYPSKPDVRLCWVAAALK
jgi:beta-mannosidase